MIDLETGRSVRDAGDSPRGDADRRNGRRLFLLTLFVVFLGGTLPAAPPEILKVINPIGTGGSRPSSFTPAGALVFHRVPAQLGLDPDRGGAVDRAHECRCGRERTRARVSGAPRRGRSAGRGRTVRAWT